MKKCQRYSPQVSGTRPGDTFLELERHCVPGLGQGGAEAVGGGGGLVPACKPPCKPSARFPVRTPHLQTLTAPLQLSQVQCTAVTWALWAGEPLKTPLLSETPGGGPQG